MVLTGTQVSFGYQDSDARLAFRRLEKALEQLRRIPRQAAMVHYYPLSQSLAEQVRKVRIEFYDPGTPPAATMLPFRRSALDGRRLRGGRRWPSRKK